MSESATMSISTSARVPRKPGGNTELLAELVGTWIGKFLIERISETLFRVVFRLLVTVMALRMLYVAYAGAVSA